MKKIGVAVIGLGGRGEYNINTTLYVSGDDIVITAVCDIYEDRCDKTAKLIYDKTGLQVYKTTDYKEILKRDDVQVVMITTSWETHVPIAIDAMRAGKIVGMEVGGTMSVEECFELVKVYEETKTPFMFLENCCYNKNELLVRNMVKAGLFGEIVHCHGSYSHDCREQILHGKEWRHYRLNHYLNRNCENYPTHDLGPIAKIIGINRGNRMVSLISVASKAASLEEYVREHPDAIPNKDLIGKKFNQGDIVTTIITCENGETVTLTLDTTLPRFYSREFTVRGTKGMYEENVNAVVIESSDSNNPIVEHQLKIDSAKDYEQEYLPDYWKNITQEEIALGHGGMDKYMFDEFYNCVRYNKPMPIDVYDAAAWMVITPLSEESIAKGGVKVDIPDFTNGKWKTRERFDV